MILMQQYKLMKTNIIDGYNTQMKIWTTQYIVEAFCGSCFDVCFLLLFSQIHASQPFVKGFGQMSIYTQKHMGIHQCFSFIKHLLSTQPGGHCAGADTARLNNLACPQQRSYIDTFSTNCRYGDCRDGGRGVRRGALIAH